MLAGAAAAACAADAPARKKADAYAERDAVFKTTDGWTLRGRYIPPRGKKPVVLLLHGLGSAHHEWAAFAEVLKAKGFGSLRYDARGHGQSLQGPAGETHYQEFVKAENRAQWTRMTYDVDAAAAWLRARKIPESRIAIAGASLGANVALLAAGEHPKFAFAIALSPSLDYQGVRPAGAMRGFGKRPLILVAAEKDPYALRGTRSLAHSARGNEHLTYLERERGHGVQMLDPGFLESLFPLLKY